MKEEGGGDKAEGESRKAKGSDTAPSEAGGHPSSLIPHPSGSAERSAPRVKMNNKESRELAALPGEISSLEGEQATLAARMTAPEYFKQPADILRADQARAAEIETQLMAKLERWEALEAKAKAAAS